MSYALELVADARRALASLEVDVQEVVFDALDRVADEADRLPPDEVRVQHVIVRLGREATYVRVHYEVDRVRRLVMVQRLVAIVVDES